MEAAAKGRYPWRMGAPSYVAPANVLTNVRLLADLVDDVQLLFFESAANAALSHDVPVAALKEIAEENNLSFTVHLPGDIFLGDASPAIRQQGVAEIMRLFASLAPLEPRCFDLHVNRLPGQPLAGWQKALEQSFAALAGELGEQKDLLAIENIDYPYSSVAPLVERFGFGVCLDFGHILHYDHDWSEAIRHVSNAAHIHYHGIHGGRDHGAVTASQKGWSEALGLALMEKEFRGVLTLEVYDLKKLEISMATLGETWKPFAKE